MEQLRSNQQPQCLQENEEQKKENSESKSESDDAVNVPVQS